MVIFEERFFSPKRVIRKALKDLEEYQLVQQVQKGTTGASFSSRVL